MKNQKQQPGKFLFKAEFTNLAVDYLSDDQLTRINEICKGEFIKGDVQSINQVKPLSEQKANIDKLIFDLQQSTQILSALVHTVYQADVNANAYKDLMNNISYFIHNNIIDESKRVVDELNSVIEFETE